MESQHSSLAVSAINVIGVLGEELQDKSLMNDSFVTIAIKVRSFFEHEDSNLRCAAFDCFRKLYSLANRDL
ncbi:hypothetical protein DQ04_00661130 [Trypanosoma grayi]|uniref:hypothetical protein n=1 Tax=Trypanosoma grayi TaxID=71804 RepID=UPI0004F4BE5F|nr:hypothetical protein DQ04_00661130 [Trypanosoma grayi]KEG14035.1 hypothetical protein DQ04_00661130 [Trypanosoma grayi]